MLNNQSHETWLYEGQTPVLPLTYYFRIQELQYFKNYVSADRYHIHTQSVQYCPYFMLACRITCMADILIQKCHIWEKVVSRLGVLIDLFESHDRLALNT